MRGRTKTDLPTADSASPILIIEDEENERSPLQLYLEGRGYSVVTAANGAEALYQLRGGVRPCVILLDLTMPYVDGFGFRRTQLQDPVLQDIPVILLSGTYDARMQASSLGAAAYAQKPIDLTRLSELIEQHRLK